MAEENDDRTEDPTERRRAEAREQGNVAKSSDLTAAALMLAAAAAVLALAPPMSQQLAELTVAAFSSVSLSLDQGRALQLGSGYIIGLGEAVLPVLLLAGLVSLGSNLMQVGVLFSPEALQPKFSRISPLAGVKRILSIRAVAKLGVSLGKLAILTSITSLLIGWALPEFLLLTGSAPGVVAVMIHESSARLAFSLAAALLVLALLDFSFQKWKHEQELRMTKQEVRDEMKNMEGDPHIRHRRREAHRKLAQSREMQSVKGADVVVTNPTHYAVALKYDPDRMPAPVVVAKGVDTIALQIRKIAAEHDVPILERPELARALYASVKVGRAIPVDLYEAFVEIMAYVYRITGKTPKNLRKGL
ncbi:MAG: flagellar biosynthesis protein FlhB [Planctomycetota bacterium]|nr:flagellar biosynthesis protein FlhB [Planctomycetaceae bacterium]MDQ3333234.1 flagellar biosynthesis protein FlhB [Planctomycetota bacterium]